jgi:mRNA interferase RelE/StbE
MNAVEKLEAANSLRDISNIKSMQGYPGFYRIRFGDFRIGFRLVDENTIRLLAIEHRSVFYRDFP